MLGLQPHDEHLIIDPALPPGMGRIELLDIPGRWGLLDTLGRSRTPHESQQSRVSAAAHAPTTSATTRRQ